MSSVIGHVAASFASAFTAIRTAAVLGAYHNVNRQRLLSDDLLPHSQSFPHLAELALVGRSGYTNITAGMRYVARRISDNEWEVFYASAPGVARVGTLPTPDIASMFYVAEVFERASGPAANADAYHRQQAARDLASTVYARPGTYNPAAAAAAAVTRLVPAKPLPRNSAKRTEKVRRA